MSDNEFISAQLLELNRNFTTLVGEFSEFRGEVRTGIEGMHKRQDATNGRVTTLEAGHARTLVNQAAQDAFTPGMYKALEEMKVACKSRHDNLTKVLVTMNEADTEDQVQRAHEDGARSTDAQYRAWLYIVACAIGAIILTAWQTWPPKWWPTR